MEKGAYSQIILDGELKNHEFIQRDKAFVTTLFYGVLERQITLDYAIDRQTGSKKPEKEIRVLLRMALYQILFMDSVPDNAAVNESVELSPSRAKGYVNAVLRNFLRSDRDFIKGESLENLDLYVKYSCPQWLIDKFRDEYGEEALMQILTTSLLKPPEFTRTFMVSAPGEAGKRAEVLRQDLSSQQACELFNPQPGEIIIDLCAAPGGKSFTIASLMNNQGRVISCDINRKKLKTVEKTAERLGLSIIETHENDAKIFNPDFPAADRVLCDVPCSGLGVIRRKPEIKYKNPGDFEGLPEIQSQILQTASRYVKESGTLMYSTCTLSRAENDDVIVNFLSNNSDFKLVDKHTVIPSRDGGDGFFTAVLRRY